MMRQPTEQIKFKICGKCKTEKATNEFYKRAESKDGLQVVCKDCARAGTKAYSDANRDAKRAYTKAYDEANRDAKRAYNKAYGEANREANLARNKAYNEANREGRRAYDREHREAKAAYMMTRRKNDPLFSLRHRISRLIGISITNQGYAKYTKTYAILGCSFEEFKAHIESQFVEGMGWHNRDEWHLDHIFPVSKAVGEAHLIALNHYTNFQPLWAADNRSKGNKLPEELLAAIPVPRRAGFFIPENS